MENRLRLVAVELARHVPFTALGTALGSALIAILVSSRIAAEALEDAFYIFHPLHLLLSAIATTAIYVKYSNPGGRRTKWARIAAIGYIGTVGPGTISDSLIPYMGEALLSLPNPEAHIGFVERWWLVNPMVAIGIAIGYLGRRTKIPHAGHVMLSTLASLFHIAMALDGADWIPFLPALSIFLFFAVWIPCCTSDIVFPLLFVRGDAIGRDPQCDGHADTRPALRQDEEHCQIVHVGPGRAGVYQAPELFQD